MVIKTNVDKKKEKQIAEEKKIKESAAGTTAEGQYPGRVNTTFTIGKLLNNEGVQTNSIPGEYTNEAEFKQKQIEVRKAAQLALLQEAENSQPIQTNVQTPQTNVPQNVQTTETPQQKEMTIEEQNKQAIEQPKTFEEFKYSKSQQPVGKGEIPLITEIGQQAQFENNLSVPLQIWDTIKTAFTRKKPLKYENALQGLDARISIIKNNIGNAKTGTPYYEAENDLNKAIDEFRRLQMAAKGFGKLNLNWLIDDGISIQAEIDNKLSELENLRIDIENIKASQRTGQIQTFRQQYGL